MTAATLTQHIASTQTSSAARVTDADLKDLRNRGDRLLRDMAFVLHLTRKVKQQILDEQEDAVGEEAVLAGV